MLIVFHSTLHSWNSATSLRSHDRKDEFFAGASSVESHQDDLGLELLPCEERLRELGFFILEKSGKLIAASKCLQEGYWKDIAKLFRGEHCVKMTDDGQNLKQDLQDRYKEKLFFFCEESCAFEQIARGDCAVSILGFLQADPALCCSYTFNYSMSLWIKNCFNPSVTWAKLMLQDVHSFLTSLTPNQHGITKK